MIKYYFRWSIQLINLDFMSFVQCYELTLLQELYNIYSCKNKLNK